MNRQRSRGFSLIELIMVIVILSTAAVAILGLFTQASSSLLINDQIQTAAQLAQAGAENVLATRRNQNFAAVAVGTSTEALAGNYAAYTRTTVISSPPAAGGCPVVAGPAPPPGCKGVSVTVTEGGSTLAEIDFVLVDY